MMLVFVASPPSEQQIISMMLIWMLMMIMKLSNGLMIQSEFIFMPFVVLYPAMTSDIVVFASK